MVKAMTCFLDNLNIGHKKSSKYSDVSSNQAYGIQVTTVCQFEKTPWFYKCTSSVCLVKSIADLHPLARSDP